MRVIGTAGHVDHGKSTLVHRLTGINPDRLKEELARQMTIDLGFAWMTLPDGQPVGIIDVPGHRDFIENMLAGVGGIDAALLVVAADEGVMPQTREHLAILGLLDVNQGLVALTKTDLVNDEEWIALVKDDIARLLRGTQLEGAPVVPVSARTGSGLDLLVASLADVLRGTRDRPNLGRPRLPIDRAFTMSGFGTIVTGTLLDGNLSVGESIEIVPGAHEGRIRGLQTHKSKIDLAVAGSRVAANVTGIEHHEIQRGDVLARPGTYQPTDLIDVRVRMLSDPGDGLKHNQSVKVFLGAAQRMGRVRVLGSDEVGPGEEGWLQLALDEPLVTARGDRFVLRRPSPGATLGGGQVVDPMPERRHRRRDARVRERLSLLLKGTPGQVLAQSLAVLGPVILSQAIEHAGLDEEAAEIAVAELIDQKAIIPLGESPQPSDPHAWVVSTAVWEDLVKDLVRILNEFHRAYPLRQGMPREELKSRVGLEPRAFSVVLGYAFRQGGLVDLGQKVRLSRHSPTPTPRQEEQINELLGRVKAAGYSPPSFKECTEAVGEEVMTFLLERGQLVQLSSDVVFEGQQYEDAVDRVKKELQQQGTLSVAQVRDLFGTSRKYSLAIMEHLDSIGVTTRVGDVRRLAGDTQKDRSG